MTNFLWEGGVACDVLEGSTDEFVGLNGFAGGHVAEDAGVWSDWHCSVLPCCRGCWCWYDGEKEKEIEERVEKCIFLLHWLIFRSRSRK